MKNSGGNISEQFDDLYDRYYAQLVLWFRKNADYDDAEDLAQQTFLQLWGWLGTNEPIKKEKALIFSVAKNVRNDYFRRRAAQIVCAAPFEELESALEDDFSSNVETFVFLQNLPLEDRKLMELKRQGLSSKEIGRIFGLSASAVRTRLQKLRKELEKQIK